MTTCSYTTFPGDNMAAISVMAVNAKYMKQRPTCLVYDESMSQHRCLLDDKHPECPERFIRVLDRYNINEVLASITADLPNWSSLSMENFKQIIKTILKNIAKYLLKISKKKL
ncbi:uncharacterized protein isoform X2 [Musca autumnalis]